MKYLNQLTTLLLAVILITSCKKDKIKSTPLASLNVTNAVVGGKTVRLGSNKSDSAVNMNFKQFGLIAGENSVYLWPTSDSTNPYYNESKFVANEGEVYSLFLTGVPGAVEAVKIKETIPYRTDSVAGIRFINLAANKPSLDITLSTTPTVNEVAALNYKSYTDFKTYAGLYNSAPTFQVRKADGTLLTSFAFNTSTIPRFANVTLVIRQNGAGVSVFRVNNDR